MNQFRIECSEVTYFTVLVEADNEDQAREKVHANVNSFDVENEYVSEWSIETVEEIWPLKKRPFGLSFFCILFF